MGEAPILLSLSAKGLERLQNVSDQSDFAFIVGLERYSCPSFVAEFLSPRVSSLRSQDITIDELPIDTADPTHQFGTFLSIGFGHAISFTRADLGFVRSVCDELWNSELFETILTGGEGPIQEDELKARLAFFSGAEGRFDWDVSVLASHFYEFAVSDFDQLSPSLLQALLSDSKLVLGDEDTLFEIVHRRASEDLMYFGLLEFVRFEFLSAPCMTRAAAFISSSLDSLTFGIWSSLRTRLMLPVAASAGTDRLTSLPAIDSKIVSAIPEIFSGLGDATFQLLYRGSRDGFGASEFHRRCDRHPNTVTLILSTNDCIFGGYTPRAWNSGEPGFASDPSLRSFVFTLKNPHNLPPQIFKQKRSECAIYDNRAYGPTFGYGFTLHIGDDCHRRETSHSNFVSTYTNDTGIAAQQVLAGVCNFTVEEIEVFEVIEKQ
jgi:hypothetical protein